MGANGRDSKRIWAKRLKNWCFFEKRGLVMKNTFVLFAFVTCMAAQVRKAPEPDVSMSKSYDAPVEKVFGAMVQAASSYEIKLASKDGCLLKFATAMPGTTLGSIAELLGAVAGQRRGGPEPVETVEFTAMCSSRGHGTTVNISAASREAGRMVPRFDAFVKRTASEIWSSLDYAIPATVAGKAPAGSPAAVYFDSGYAKGKGDLDGAIADFTKAIEVRPDYAEAYNLRGLAKQAKGNLDGAVEDFTKAIEINPDYAGAYDNRGLAEETGGNLASAAADRAQATLLRALPPSDSIPLMVQPSRAR